MMDGEKDTSTTGVLDASTAKSWMAGGESRIQKIGEIDIKATTQKRKEQVSNCSISAPGPEAR